MNEHVSEHASHSVSRLSLESIEKAAGQIDSAFRNSPQFLAESLSSRLGCKLIVKVETVNPIRSFKARGAQAFVAQRTDVSHFACVTAGNFGQGMAYAARVRGVRLTAFAKSDANTNKLARIRDFGAEVQLIDGDLDEVHSAAREFAAKSGALLVQDGRGPAIAEGAGTIGLELLDWKEPLDAVIAPVGDGALLGGVATCFKKRSPGTRMIGVCSAGAPAMERSWRSGKVQACRPETIADGIAIQTPFAEPLAELRRLADDFLLVEDQTIAVAMKLAHRELGLLLEPAGATGLAGIIAHKTAFQGKTVATVLTGGNLSESQFQILTE